MANNMQKNSNATIVDTRFIDISDHPLSIIKRSNGTVYKLLTKSFILPAYCAAIAGVSERIGRNAANSE